MTVTLRHYTGMGFEDMIEYEITPGVGFYLTDVSLSDGFTQSTGTLFKTTFKQDRFVSYK